MGDMNAGIFEIAGERFGEDRATLGHAPRRGPLIVQEYDATCLVPHTATAELDRFGNIRLTLTD